MAGARQSSLNVATVAEDWLLRNRVAIESNLEESFAQAARGEGYTLDEVKELLDRTRNSRSY